MAITYKQSGVNIDAGNELVRRIKKKLPVIGGFGGLFPLAGTKYSLVSSTDGVGTKLKLAFMLNKHNTVGIDLVGMNVNDLICCGAKPIFFLDYFACGKLDVNSAEQVISGIIKGCELADCKLIGGETAEMPGFYPPGEYDLAGFSVGTLKKGREISGRNIKPGDVVIGLPSSGPHSNGYSLIRKVLSKADIRKYSKELLAPTRIYVKEIMGLLSSIKGKPSEIVHGIAHITGGSFYDKIERVLPDNCRVVIDKNAWEVPEIFKLVQKKGKIADKEIYRVLNMGIGMVLIVKQSAAPKVLKSLKGSKEIGFVVKHKKGVDVV